MSIINIGLCGINSKMCKIIKQILNSYHTLNLTGGYSSKDCISKLQDLCQNSELIIDFSRRSLLRSLVKKAIASKTKLLIGTTGLTDRDFDMLNSASKEIAILYSANMSLGANLLNLLATNASEFLDEDYDIEILDFHHRDKRDSPSGTAIMVAKSIAEACKKDLKKQAPINDSNPSAINRKIHLSSIRCGGIYGEHHVLFCNKDEMITIKHQSLGRELFAKGALKAALWLINQEPGMYSMKDVLNFGFYSIIRK